jgi:tetratricopeptide (TPR) repeat protein
MSFLDRFRNSKPSAPEPEVEPSPETSAASPAQKTLTVPAGSLLQRPEDTANTKRPDHMPATVRVYDEFGRELQIPVEDWRTNILPAALEKVQDDPDKLYNLILDSLQLRLASDMLAAAERLHAIDPSPERSATIYGIVLMESGDPLAAKRIFANYLAQHEPSCTVLTNLAKAQTALGEQAEADVTLWRALEADPNQENGLGWYVAIARDHGGEGAYIEALKRVAELPTAWRPQIWLARAVLEHNEPTQAALSLYWQALERAGKPAPMWLLQSMSGDLGKTGHLGEALALTRPAYDAKIHGLAVGNNLIKAALDLGEIKSARSLVEELYHLNRPDWADTLHFWETEIRRKELAGEQPLSAPKVTAYTIEGPAWSPPNAPSRTLFEPSAPRRAKVVFLGSSVIGLQTQKFFAGHLSDAPGRLSRALPLFLAESAFLHLGLDTDTIVPWVEHSGFAVVATPWSEKEAVEYAHKTNAAAAVSIDIHCIEQTIQITLRVFHAQQAGSTDPAVFAELTVPFSLEHAGTGTLGLWSQLKELLVQLFGNAPATIELSRYTLPDNDLGTYLLRLEQLLAVLCTGSEDAANSLTGVREIVRGDIDLALKAPHSLPARLILHETLLRLRNLYPQIADEFRHPAELLQQRYPFLDAQANAILERQLQAIYGSSKA